MEFAGADDSICVHRRVIFNTEGTIPCSCRIDLFGRRLDLADGLHLSVHNHAAIRMMTNPASCLLDFTSLIRNGPVRWLVVGGTLLIAAIVIGATLTVQNFRERALHHRARETENTVRLMAFHLDQYLQHLVVVQKDLIRHIRSNGITTTEGYKTSLSGQDTHLMLRSKMDTLPYAGGLNIFDADGNLVNTSTAWPVTKINVADRTHFQTFRSDPRSPDTMIEPVIGRLSGKWTIILARRVMGPNGEFLGVVSQSIDPVHFEKFFATVVLGSGAAIAMFHRDGKLLARYPHMDRVIGKNFGADMPAFKKSVLERDQHFGRRPRPVNGEDSLLSSRLLENFPVVLVATTAISEALADWREQIGSLITVAIASALAIAVLLIAVVRKLSEQHRISRARLILEMQRLDLAVNNMPQGLALFDSSARLVICNQRFIEMFGLSSEVVKPGCSFHEITEHRKAVVSIAAEVDEYVEYIKNVLHDRHERGSTIIDTFDGRAIQVINEPLADGGCVVTHEDITERQRIKERITHLAHYDALTDLPNRAMFQEHLRQQLASIADGEQLAVHYIDIDEFKDVNDALGHLVGDELLKSIGASLIRCAGENDLVARLGGDEFAIVQSHVTSTERITDLVERVFETIREPFDCMGHRLTTDASIGIALAPQHGTAPDQILKNADLAMYAAKSAGRNTYRFFEPEMDAKVRERLQIEIDLREAIAHGELEVYYQPFLSLKDDTITGCEALVRWQHPERGMVSPAEFIPVAEDTGLINEIGEWVLNTACRDAASWPCDTRLAVNVSPVQFRSETLPLKIMASLSASNLPASRLELEITEAVLIRDDDAALAILHQLRAIGVRIALDDFGTGYSSLSYLQRFPFDKIKIDRRFVVDIASLDGSSSIVQAVVNIAADRRMTTTAEGVETEEQKHILHALGCTEMQGYLFSAAKPLDKIKELLSSASRLAAG